MTLLRIGSAYKTESGNQESDSEVYHSGGHDKVELADLYEQSPYHP